MDLLAHVENEEYPVTVRGSDTVADIVTAVGSLAGMDLVGLAVEHEGCVLGQEEVVSRLPLRDGDVVTIRLTRRILAARELRENGWFVTHSSFQKAVETGDVESAELFLEALPGAQNFRSPYGQTFLQSLCERGLAVPCEFLLSHGADTELRTANGWTALHYATFYRNEEIISLLLQYGASVRWTDPEDVGNTIKTPMMLAARSGDAHVVSLFTEHGADPCLADNEGATALHYAILNNQLEVVKVLSAAGAPSINHPNHLGRTPTHLAIDAANPIPILTTLLAHGASPTSGHPLHHACLRRNLPAIDLLMAYAAPIDGHDSHHHTPLHVVLADYSTKVRCGQAEPGVIVRRLLQAGADPQPCSELAALHGLNLVKPTEG